jgi:hypothetical protein
MRIGAGGGCGMTTNKYGLDTNYMKGKLKIFLRDIDCHTPDEAARVLARLSKVADEKVLREPEFSARDTYRELCGEMLKALKNSSTAAYNHTANLICCGKVGQQCCGEPDADWPAWAKQLMDDNHGAITKAEKLLGEQK